MHSTSEQRPSTSTTASNAYPAPFASSRKSVTWPQPSSHDHAPPTEDRPSTDPGCGTTGRRLGPGDNRAKCKQERMFRSSSQLVASGGLNWQILASIATTGGAGTRPEVSGWPRLTSAVCGEYARKLLWTRRLRWSQACNLGTGKPHRDVPVGGVDVGDVAVPDPNVAAVDGLQTGHHSQRGRLPAAGRTDQDEELAIVDEQVDRVDRRSLCTGVEPGRAVEGDRGHPDASLHRRVPAGRSEWGCRPICGTVPRISGRRQRFGR